MGTTDKYALPWPSPVGFVRDGAAAIRGLAEAVENALLPPTLLTNASTEPDWGVDKTGRVGWDLTTPGRVRGVWTGTSAANRVIVPPSPGLFLVACSYRFGGKSSADRYQLAIQTLELGAGEASASTQILNQVEIPSQAADTYSQLVASTPCVIPAGYGLQIRVQYDQGAPPAADLAAHKLRIYKLSNW